MKDERESIKVLKLRSYQAMQASICYADASHIGVYDPEIASMFSDNAQKVWNAYSERLKPNG